MYICEVRYQDQMKKDTAAIVKGEVSSSREVVILFFKGIKQSKLYIFGGIGYVCKAFV